MQVLITDDFLQRLDRDLDDLTRPNEVRHVTLMQLFCTRPLRDHRNSLVTLYSERVLNFNFLCDKNNPDHLSLILHISFSV